MPCRTLLPRGKYQELSIQELPTILSGRKLKCPLAPRSPKSQRLRKRHFHQELRWVFIIYNMGWRATKVHRCLQSTDWQRPGAIGTYSQPGTDIEPLTRLVSQTHFLLPCHATALQALMKPLPPPLTFRFETSSDRQCRRSRPRKRTWMLVPPGRTSAVPKAVQTMPYMEDMSMCLPWGNCATGGSFPSARTRTT